MTRKEKIYKLAKGTYGKKTWRAIIGKGNKF